MHFTSLLQQLGPTGKFGKTLNYIILLHNKLLHRCLHCKFLVNLLQILHLIILVYTQYVKCYHLPRRNSTTLLHDGKFTCVHDSDGIMVPCFCIWYLLAQGGTGYTPSIFIAWPPRRLPRFVKPVLWHYSRFICLSEFDHHERHD